MNIDFLMSFWPSWLAESSRAWTAGAVLLGMIVFGLVLTKVWLGIINFSLLHLEPLSSIEKRRPYIPKIRAVLGTLLCTGVIALLSLKTIGRIAPFEGPEGPYRLVGVFSIITILWIAAELHWKRAREYAFAFMVGTMLTFVLIGLQRSIMNSSLMQDPYFLALGIVCMALAWRFLFGPWAAHVKATILGTFIFWFLVHMLWPQDHETLMASFVAIGVALLPAVLWCILFLYDHRQRMSTVLLMFFAGMLSTAPILFYDSLVRRGVELKFFLFTIKPENFTRSSNAFVTGNLTMLTDVRSSLMSALIAFVIVGLIEEFSKYWMVHRSGEQFASSIDDVIQFSVLVAIGFAFAENILNPSYFLAFVQQHLFAPESPQWGSFLGNVVGRSILTSMVHILSTGVMGYFLGRAIFATPIERDLENQGKEYIIPYLFQLLFRLSPRSVFRVQMIFTGLLAAVVLHGLFNFLVTLPEILPGNPDTLGDFLGAPATSILHSVSFLLIPSLFYVVGGFWLLTTLFYRKESTKEHGILLKTDTFVTENAIA